MRQVEDVRARVHAAGELAELLGVAWDALTVLRDACRECGDTDTGLFAAFAFAATAAAQARLTLASAPSLPAARGTDAGHASFVSHGLGDGADRLAGLARVLHERLSQAATDAGDPGDREVCKQAAAEAAQVVELLSRDGP
ncbi:MAG TPA: hypothetical protein VGS19_37285 [Streptosporangiaceae bacterium]|nr:hypothetical protein [Streptosporangiaceae bacterium]